MSESTKPDLRNSEVCWFPWNKKKNSPHFTAGRVFSRRQLLTGGRAELIVGHWDLGDVAGVQFLHEIRSHWVLAALGATGWNFLWYLCEKFGMMIWSMTCIFWVGGVKSRLMDPTHTKMPECYSIGCIRCTALTPKACPRAIRCRTSLSMTPRPGPAAPFLSALSMAFAAAEISQISAVMAAWRFLGDCWLDLFLGEVGSVLSGCSFRTFVQERVSTETNYNMGSQKNVGHGSSFANEHANSWNHGIDCEISLQPSFVIQNCLNIIGWATASTAQTGIRMSNKPSWSWWIWCSLSLWYHENIGPILAHPSPICIQLVGSSTREPSVLL